MLSDEEIIELYFRRDEQAVEETRSRYGRMCLGIAMRILHSMEDAEECENDTYLRTWEAIPPERPTIFSAFLGKITRNLALDRYEQSHAAKRGGGQIPLILDELSECIADGHGDAFDSASDISLRDALNQFLETLPKEKRVIFMRRYWYGDSIEEIARRYGFGVSKVKTTLMRARRQLKEELREVGYAV